MKQAIFRFLVPVFALSFSVKAWPNANKVDDTLKGRSSVPPIQDGAAPSEERKSIDSLMARADQGGKKLILVVSAAWCGPCTDFWQEISTHPEDLKELAEQGYILAKVESEKIVSGPGADFFTMNDFLPANVNFFPSFYLYAKGQWTAIGTQNSYSDLKTTLAGNITPLSYADAVKAIGSKDDASKSRVYFSLFGNFDGLYSYTEAKNLVDALKKSGDQDYQSIADFVQGFMWVYVGAGALDIASFTQDFPDEGVKLSDASNEEFNTEPFTNLLEAAWRKDGVKSAAAKCDSMWTGYKKQITPGKLSAGDFATKIAALDLQTQFTCLHLQMLAAGSLTADLKAKMDALDASKLADWALLAADGNVDKAIGIYHTRYQHFSDSYAKETTRLQGELDKAKASGDQAKIAEAQHHLDVANFRTQYHAEVDSEVEQAIRNGTALNAVHEIQ